MKRYISFILIMLIVLPLFSFRVGATTTSVTVSSGGSGGGYTPTPTTMPSSGGGGGGGIYVPPAPTISKMGFVSIDGTEISEVGVNVYVKGYADINNRYAVAKDNIASFFVACYVDSKLYSAKTFTVSIDANTLSKRVATDLISVPQTDKEVIFKICAWDNFVNMKPIMQPQTIIKPTYNLTVKNSDIDSVVLLNNIIAFKYWATPTDRVVTIVTLPSNATIYINDAQITNANLVEKLSKGAFYGNVTFEKKNSSIVEDYDTINITDYKNYVVDHISTSEFKVYFKNSADTISFNPNDTTIQSTLQDTSGNAIAFADLKDSDILSCKVSNVDGKLKTVATLVKNQVRGIITEIDSTDVNNPAYMINYTTYHLDTKSVSPSQLSLALDAYFYIDLLGNIAWFEKYYPAPNYAYVMATALGYGFDNNIQMKVLTDKGEILVLSTATKVKVDGINYINSTNLINGYNFSNITGQQATDLYNEHGYGTANLISSTDIPKLEKGQLITYSLNSSNQITMIDRPNPKVADKIGLNGTFAQYGTTTATSEYSKATNTLTTTNNNVILTDKTVIMVAYGTNEDDYELVNVSAIADGQTFNNVKFYDVNKYGEVGIVVVGSQVTLMSSLCAVSGISTGINVDGDIINKIRALQNGVSAILNGAVTLTTPPILGSAIIPILSNSTGEVKSFTTLAVPNDTSNVATFTVPTASGVLDGKTSYIYGLVTERRAYNITTTSSDFAISGTTNVYIYDERISSTSNRVYLGDVTDINATLNGGITTYDFDVSKVYAIAREYDGKIVDVIFYIFQ